MKRSIYIFPEKYQILKKKKKKDKNKKQSLVAFLGVQSQQEMIIHNVEFSCWILEAFKKQGVLSGIIQISFLWDAPFLI